MPSEFGDFGGCPRFARFTSMIPNQHPVKNGRYLDTAGIQFLFPAFRNQDKQAAARHPGGLEFLLCH
jgi:hypothetical protein